MSLNLACMPFALVIKGTREDCISLGNVQNSEWVLEVNHTYTHVLGKMDFALRRTSSIKSVIVKLVLFIPNRHSYQDFDFTFHFAIGQLNLRGIEITTPLLDTFPRVYGVVHLYQIPDSCIQHMNGIVTTILLPSLPAQHQTDFTTLLESDPQDLSDAVLNCQGVKMAVHMCIISARCPVLAAIFTSDMEEARTKTADIDDVDPDILRDVLKYIYSGRGDFPDAMAGDVLDVAEKYGLIELKNICIEKLKSNFVYDNVFLTKN